ncbi:PspC domain-containing protein [Roseivirga misakiensis]|uniref:Stress-responsive transcriptional regulator n=1 Tax=Roseivirga misakiensis TaxID=1563681 RepID=A0A1E5T1L4_9BACT|nr:stress-responsive transcriptional regulator [Roseivirga misakiensis]
MTLKKRKLKRLSSDRVVAGVCSGLAEWLNWDVTLVRFIYVLLSIFSAGLPGLLVYFVLWAVMTKD